MSIKMIELNPPEEFRTYHYADGTHIPIKNVTHIKVSPESGNHRLQTSDGLLYIVTPGWRYIEIKATGFTV